MMELILYYYLAYIFSLLIGINSIEIFNESYFVKLGLPDLVQNVVEGFTTNQFTSLLIGIILIAISPYFLVNASNLVYYKSNTSLGLKLLIHFLTIVFISLYMVKKPLNDYHVNDLIDCGIIFCSYSTKKYVDTANGFKQLIGFIMIIQFIGIIFMESCKIWFIIANYLNVENNQNHYHLHSNKSKPPSKWKFIFMIIIVLVLGILSSALLPASFLKFTPNKIKSDGMLDVSEIGFFKTFDFKVSRPELENAWLRTFTISTSHGVFLKFYPDVLIFYATILLVCLSYRFKYLQIGIILLGTALEFNYWWYHNYHGTSLEITSILPFYEFPDFYERLARTMGQISNYLMGLLFLPIARNNIFLPVMNLSWTRSLRLHIYLSFGFLCVTTVHIICWWFVYNKQHVFPHDAFTVGKLYFPLNFHAKPGHCNTLTCLDPEYQKPAADNFTIGMMNLFFLYLALPVFGLLTLFRRYWFELFYYTHQLMVVVLIVGVLYHASSAWYFITPGVLLWFIDRIIRNYTGIKNNAKVLKMEVLDNFIHLTCLVNDSAIIDGGISFINIPQIKLLEWHPFTTIQKNENTMEFYIKPAGDWTNLLLKESLNSLDIVTIDGPYKTNNLMDYYHQGYKIIFAIGGSGISTYLSFVEQIEEENNLDLIWAVKTQSYLKDVPINNANIYITQQDEEDVMVHRNDHVQFCRPNFTNILSNYNNNNIIVFTCGPVSLINSVSDACKNLNIEYIQEVFEL